MAHNTICAVDACDKSSIHKSGGFCRNHDYKFIRYGDPLAGKVLKPRGSGLAFLHDLVANERKECVYWPYYKRGGIADYGGVYFRGTMAIASRVGCILLHGEPPTERHQAAHNCGHGREGCVNPYHTRWATPAENMADQIDHGTRRKGQQMYTCKLTPELVIAIRADMAQGGLQIATAEKYGISRWNLRAIISGRTWKHLL